MNEKLSFFLLLEPWWNKSLSLLICGLKLGELTTASSFNLRKFNKCNLSVALAAVCSFLRLLWDGYFLSVASVLDKFCRDKIKWLLFGLNAIQEQWKLEKKEI